MEGNVVRAKGTRRVDDGVGLGMIELGRWG